MFGERSRPRLLVILPTVALVVLANAAIARGLSGTRYPISESDIVKELGVVGVSVDASQVHIPAHMSAVISSPKLQIIAAQPLGDNTVRIELRCSTGDQCLPFFASLDVKEANLVSAEIQMKMVSAAVANHPAAVRMGGELVSRPQLRVGSHAVLIIRDGRLNIHLQVLAIDSGTIGQQVRVCTLDRKKVFHATVTGEGTVTGGIE